MNSRMAAMSLMAAGIAACGTLAADDAGIARVKAVADAKCSITNVAAIGTSGVMRVDFVLVSGPGSDIRCRLELPSPERWNGHFWGVGNSGLAGVIPKVETYSAAGAAVATTDLGTRQALRVTRNRRAWPLVVQHDYSWRATQMMTVYSKRMVLAYYGKPPRRSYFNGGSCGGRQGFSEAIRFPDEYDGIVVHLPANNAVAGMLGKWIIWRQTHGDDGRCLFTKEEMRVVADAAVEYCATRDPKPYAGRFLADGRVAEADLDGILELAATKMPSLREGDKIARLKGLYSPFYGDGECLFLGFAPGTYLGDWMMKRAPAEKSWREIREFAVRDGAWFNANSADLSRFFGRGGKMIVTTGWEDQTVSPLPIVEHYERICAREGGIEKTMENCRLFCAPGAAHGGGRGRATHGELGSAFARRALVDWVEKGKAPDRIEIADRPNNATFPVAVYPGLFVKDDGGEWRRVELPRSKIRLADCMFACDPSPSPGGN